MLLSSFFVPFNKSYSPHVSASFKIVMFTIFPHPCPTLFFNLTFKSWILLTSLCFKPTPLSSSLHPFWALELSSRNQSCPQLRDRNGRCVHEVEAVQITLKLILPTEFLSNVKTFETNLGYLREHHRRKTLKKCGYVWLLMQVGKSAWY